MCETLQLFKSWEKLPSFWKPTFYLIDHVLNIPALYITVFEPITEATTIVQISCTEQIQTTKQQKEP